MTNDDYLMYLYSKKDELSLSWKDIADLMRQCEDRAYSEDKYRKRCKYLSETGYNKVCDAYECEFDDTKDEADLFSIEEEFSAQKALQRLRDERNQLKQYYRQYSREDTLKDLAKECAAIIADANPFTLKIINQPKNEEVEGVLEISDWHYGITIDSHWNEYSPAICIDRVNSLLNKTIELIKKNNISTIRVLNLGDLISGRIHSQIRIENREDVISQVINVSELLAKFLNSLSEYASVEYYDCLDNHSRIEPNMKESLRLESLARITTWYLCERFKYSNRVCIHFNKYSDDIIMFDTLGWKFAGVHGDLDKLSTVVKNLQTFTRNSVDVICTAHLHHFSCNEENGCTVISNPSLMGMDSFAESKRLYSKPAQTFFIVSKDQPVESIHRIIVD